MNNTNMFSAKKVKLHGMTSTKWTTKDKITQYKGLINLYTRDRKIIEMDTVVAQKKQYRQWKQVQKDVDANRKELDNAIGGDKQQLRNTLAEHKFMQLAFQNSKPKKVIENVNHLAFNKRKELDRLEYKMKQRSQKYVDLKLYASILEDNLKFNKSHSSLLPEEKQAQIITGKVQDAILKREAALAIRQTYSQIIDITKRDALYFDAVLDTIENDGMMQGKCMINATKLGQLATEYLDDRRQEFEMLEKAVKKDMICRRKDLAKFTAEEKEFSNNIRNLVRRDSDINLGRIEIDDSPSCMTLQRDIENLEEVLTYLKNHTFVPTFEAISPCLQDQMSQKQRLEELAEECEKNRDILLNKTNHAKLMKTELENTMVETTNQYNTEKIELNYYTGEEKEKITGLEVLINTRKDLLASVVTCLKQLQQLSNYIVTDGDKKSKLALGDNELPEPADIQETDGVKIIEILTKKFTKLMSNVKQTLSGTARDEGYQKYEKLMSETTNSIEILEEIIEESLIEDVHLELHILGRDDIKARSAEIVAAHSKKDE